MSKIRLDVYLYENGYFESREKARIQIMEGNIYVNNQKEDKPGTMIKSDAKIEVRGEKMKYVSRGGYKLEKAVNTFGISLNNKICMDIGSSTGGFTDLMLQNGASKVYAVDCGTNQLDYRLRIDDRVIVMENTNARYLKKSDIKDFVDFISVDVSFISLTKIIPVFKDLLNENGESVCLIKPQFEAGRELVEKKGVVKDKNTHIEVIEKIISFIKENNYFIKGLDFSPIKGPSGNIEYLVYFAKDGIEKNFDIKEIVNKSHELFSNEKC